MIRPKKLVELIPNKYYFGAFDIPVNVKLKDTVLMTTDYTKFPQINSYFGPPNISDIWKFCNMTNNYLENSDKKLLQWSIYNFKNQYTNAVFLVGAYFLIYCNKTPNEVMEYVKALNVENSIINYIDVTNGSFELNMRYIYEGINIAILFKWYDVDTFNAKQYDKYLSNEYGQMSWIIPGKFLALADPTYYKRDFPFYIKYFKENNVQAVIRLNEAVYHKKIFERAGIIHFDYYYPDLTAPNLQIVKNFLEICTCISGAIAVHCRAGLGRTGTLIACYMMKNYALSPLQCIGWLRVCRPGSIMGPQHRFLITMEEVIHKMDVSSKCYDFVNNKEMAVEIKN